MANIPGTSRRDKLVSKPACFSSSQARSLSQSLVDSEGMAVASGRLLPLEEVKMQGSWRSGKVNK